MYATKRTIGKQGLFTFSQMKFDINPEHIINNPKKEAIIERRKDKKKYEGKKIKFKSVSELKRQHKRKVQKTARKTRMYNLLNN